MAVNFSCRLIFNARGPAQRTGCRGLERGGGGAGIFGVGNARLVLSAFLCIMPLHNLRGERSGNVETTGLMMGERRGIRNGGFHHGVILEFHQRLRRVDYFWTPELGSEIGFYYFSVYFCSHMLSLHYKRCKKTIAKKLCILVFSQEPMFIVRSCYTMLQKRVRYCVIQLHYTIWSQHLGSSYYKLESK